MPDILSVFSRWWKTFLGFVVLCSMAALLACLLSPKKYLSTATALPANSALTDRARLFNKNIQYLYSEWGDPDELDRIEGTAVLDTIYIASAGSNQLASHYGMKQDGNALYKAAGKLKENTKISRSAYGELKIRVWDEDPNMAALLANDLLNRLQQLHQNITAQSNAYILEQLKNKYRIIQQQYLGFENDSTGASNGISGDVLNVRRQALLDQISQQEKLIAEYEVAQSINPQVLIPVEKARPSIHPDKPRTVQTVLLTAFASALFIFLLAVFLESRKVKN